jgi:hypothetical protein
MFLTSGAILKFTDYKCDTLITSQDHWQQVQGMPMGWKRLAGGQFIGPATLNKKDNCIYFYSQDGIFKGDKQKDLSQLNNWIKITLPKLKWNEGQPDAAGPGINVFKLQFDTYGQLFVATENEGIGVYDGKEFHLLN